MGTKPNLKPYFISNSLFCLHIFSLSRDLFAVRPLSNILLVVHCHAIFNHNKNILIFSSCASLRAP